MLFNHWVGSDAPLLRSRGVPWGAYGWALAAVVACTVVGRLLFGHIDEANLIMVYLLGVLPVALRGDRGAAIATAVGSVAAFDFFFVKPYLTFAVSDTQYLLTFFIMGLVGVVISTLTAQLAAMVTEARQREARARALYELSRAMLTARAPAEALADGARVIGEQMGLPVSAWLTSAGGEPLPVFDPVVPLNASEAELLRWVLKDGVPAGPGTDVFPGAPTMFVPIRTSERALGALGLRASEGLPFEAVRATLETGANQMATALAQILARQEADTARAQAEAERLRSSLLSSVSHDLRTPLTGIVGAASSLVDGAEALTPEVRRELASSIVDEADRLNRLVTNLLNATRLDAGGAILARSWTSLEEVVAPALMRLKAVLAAHPVTLDFPPDLPLLYADPVLLEQIFVNLLENASKYAPPGTSVTIKAWMEGTDTVIEVSDRGPGLPMGEEARLFEKFRRYPRGGAPGAGLGLAIARGVVEAHGGGITATNRPEGGASFRFTMPVTPPPVPSTK